MSSPIPSDVRTPGGDGDSSPTEQSWNDLLAVIQSFYEEEPAATRSDVLKRIETEPIISNNRLKFGEARKIDDILFNRHSRSTHWMQAFNFPEENSRVFFPDGPRVAIHTGLFTFTLV